MEQTQLPPATWRLLRTPPATGAWNMAVDEAILEATVEDRVRPTLRLYGWAPPCLSLGYTQPIADVDFPRLSALGWGLVRRPTGGRAILHTDELTYSVIGPQAEPRLAGRILDSYQRLSQALLAALRLLEIPAEAKELSQPSQSLGPAGPVCFEVPSNYEITVGGKKLVGSAQARRKGGVLQHGSLPLFGNLERITRVLAFPEESDRQTAAARLHARATTAEEILGTVLPWEAAAEAFVQAFQDVLRLDLQPDELTPEEQARAEQLVKEKYANPDWTNRI